MSRDLAVGMTIRMRDQVSAPAQQSERNVQRSVRQTTQTYTDASRVAVSTSRMLYNVRMTQSAQAEQAVQRNVAQTEAAYQRANRNVLTGSQRLANARQQLDIRSEQTIRREIDQTVASYNRLARAGFSSSNEQARAFAAVQRKVAELNKELGKTVERESLLARGSHGMLRVGEGIAGAYAGARVLSGPVGQAMRFDQHLAMIANTSYRNLAPKDRVKATDELRAVVYAAVQEGGGTLDQAMESLEKLMAHDALGHKAAFELLPKLQRGAQAEGADPVDLGNVAVKAVQNLRFEEHDTGRVLDMGAVASHMGEFKFPDLSHYLPAQMAAAGNAGFSGARGYAKILALNETAMSTAGTAGQAGTNVTDLLNQMSSRELAHAAKRAGIKDFEGVKMRTLARGGDMLDAIEATIETIFKSDKKYQEIQRKLKTAKPGEDKELLTDMANLLQGSAIGKLFGNQQSVMALTGYITQKHKRQEVYEAAMHEWDRGGGTIAGDFDVVKAMDGFKAQQLKNEAEIAEMDALRGLNHQLGDAASKLANYAKEYPGLAKAIAGTTLAFEGLTAILLGAGLMRFVTGGRAAGAVAAADAGLASAGVAGAASAAGFGARFAGMAKAIGTRGGPLLAIASGLEAFSIAGDQSKTADEKKAAYVGVAGGAVGGLAGMAAGAATGAALGSVVPVAGNIVGAGVGAVAGYFGHEWGEKLGKMIGDAIFAQKKDEKPPVVEGHFTINLDGQHLYDFVTMAGQKAARRF
ncbi:MULTISPECIES: phage tail tape measure protein [Burkholderia]|uniref:phage tail tape measure protein n=1 Tax=Burkholderia TaxID=32008 RepID=UPI0005313F58|nr:MULTISPECIES: phage tail tape measure protein [Burkholderia]AOJ67504.1 tail tape measure protein [Burkholderia savannae]AOJ69221.1 tail tape measure protein [Burkholderia savannae]AOJ81212.1 tail tape measure protein [Burkholderia savannae]KGS01638.1 phage-related minor tail family protein [Burkholderia sp. ABCPW 111]KVG37357.1 tail tape measure protein [Burkholderia sp. MSMB0265]